MRVCIGGTFDPLHKGHKSLIKKAFEVAGKEGTVFIGITTGDMIKNKIEVESFYKRKKAIERFLSEEGSIENATIKQIFNEYGPSINGNFDAIVVSPETIHTAREINKKRKESKRKPLKIVEIPFVLAIDNLPISSTRIKNKEIDENGNIVKRD